MTKAKTMNRYIAYLSLLGTVFCTGAFFNHLISGIKHDYNQEVARLQSENESLRLELRTFKDYGRKVTVTMYRPLPHETDATPHILADGTRIKPDKAADYRFVALSRDMLKRWGGDFNYGDFVLLRGTGKKDGVYQVRDTMHKRWVNTVDILESKTAKPYKFSDVELFKYNIESASERSIGDTSPPSRIFGGRWESPIF